MKKLIIIALSAALLVGVAYLAWNYYEASMGLSDSGENEQVKEAGSVSATYNDGTTSLEVKFDNQAETVTFVHGGSEVTLPRAVSASGARYANADESIVFWEHQGEATITSNGETVFTGKKLTDSKKDQTELAGPRWIWTHTDTVEGKNPAARADQFVLTFDAETRRVFSTTDCNSLSGSYSQDGEVLSIGPLASTKMYCEGSREAIYASDLALVNSFVIEDDTLRLNLNRDYGVMYFKKMK